MFIHDVHALGLETAQGLFLTESFYWDLNDRDPRLRQEARARRSRGNCPTMVMAGSTPATLHYLKAVEASWASDSDGKKVVATR